MTLFEYINTALWVLLGLSNVRARKAVRKDVARIRMYVLAHSHPGKGPENV